MQTRIVRASLRRRMEQPPEGWTITTEATAPNGRHLEPGTECRISGERGRFRFMRAVTNADGVTWFDFWGGRNKHERQWRSFYPARIRTVHRVVKTDEGVLAEARAGKAA